MKRTNSLLKLEEMIRFVSNRPTDTERMKFLIEEEEKLLLDKICRDTNKSVTDKHISYKEKEMRERMIKQKFIELESPKDEKLEVF